MAKNRTRIQKAQPTTSDVHVNKPLTNISVAYIQRAGFIADQAFPIVPVENKSDLYYLFNRDDFWRDEAKTRAPATESAGGGFNLSTASYSCLVEAFHKDLDDQIRANADSQLQLDTAVTEFVTQKLMIRRERKWMSNFFGTGIWGTDITPGTLWDVANSTPLKDVETGKQAILQQTGFVPNTMIMHYAVFSRLRDHAAIRDQFKYTSADSIDAAMIARYFGVDRLLISSAVYTSSIEGASSPTAAYIAGSKSVLLCYSAPAPSLMQPTAGYTFAWSGFLGAANGIRIKRFRMEHLEADRIEGEMAYSMNVVASQMGYFLNGVVS